MSQIAFAFIFTLLALVFPSHSLWAATEKTCIGFYTVELESAAKKTFASLPKKNSDRYNELVKDLKQQLNTTGAYAVLDLQSFVSKISGRVWANSFPKGVGAQISSSGLLFMKDGAVFSEEPAPWQKEEIASLQAWLRELIQDALPNVPLKEGSTNVRHSTENASGPHFDEWHIDGGHASVTLSVEGVGTEKLGVAPLNLPIQQYYQIRGDKWESYCPDCKAVVVPAGYAFIFFGSQSGAAGQFSPTIHRTPKNAGSRTLFVVRF